jgi:hypothetical protein
MVNSKTLSMILIQECLIKANVEGIKFPDYQIREFIKREIPCLKSNRTINKHIREAKKLLDLSFYESKNEKTKGDDL